MKKITLFLVATLFSALSFAALNPYAYGLKSSLNADQTTLTVNYSLNADATSATFVLLDGDKEILSQTLSDITKGTYTATINLDRPDIPLGKKLSWRIDVKGAAHNTTTNVNGYRLYHPSSVDVDNNPESPNFGRILCNEAMNSVKSKTTTYISAGFGAGIFAFNAAFEPINNGTSPGFNGGNSFVNTHNLYTTTNSSGTKVYNQTAYVTRRIRISDDGRIFLTSLNPTQDAYLWEVNPDDLNDWKPIFQYSKKNSKYDMEDASGNFVAGPNVGFDVRGTGDNLQLLMLSANINGMQFNQNEFKYSEYDLGTNTSWNKAPSRERKFTKNYAISFTGCQVQYDNEGGVWLIQYRTTSTDAQPALVHINANGEQDYIEKINNFRNAGFRFNHDFTKVITADGRNKNGTYTEGFARIYNVSKDANGKPVLEYWKVIDLSNVGKDLNDFAWDIANNIYVVGHNSEWIRAYALARTADDIATTPCASKYEFTINSAAQMSKASELNPYAYNLSSIFNSATKELTVNYTLNANATGVDIVILDGNMELKRVTCSGTTRGTYTETISLASDNLPLNRALSWKVDVKGISKSVPTQVSTYYSLYCPHGLAIDNNPNSEYFGRILAAEALDAVPATGYISSGQGAGLYVFNPDFSTDGKVFNGGLDFTRKLASKGFQPWRVKISEDGRIFVSSLDLNGVAVWEVSQDLQTWKKFIAGTNNTNDYRIYNSDNVFLAGPNVAMDVQGSGDNLKLLLYSTNKNGIAYNQNGYRLDEYSLTKSMSSFTDVTKIKAITAFNGANITSSTGTKYKYAVAHNLADLIYDGEGGYWFGASRGGNAEQPNLAHVNSQGEQDYYNISNENQGGGGLLIYENSLYGKVLIKGSRTDNGKTTGAFRVYLIGKDASGKPTLTKKWTITSPLGQNHNAFAVDYAENLYIVGNNAEKIVAFALPYDGLVSTPCATKYEFTPLAGWAPASTNDLNPFAYDLSSELIDGGMNLTVNYALNATANSAKVVIMNGTTEVKTVDCTGLTKGTHTLTISTEDLPTNTDLTWKVVVNGTSVTKVQEYSTKYSLYHPSSVDIDNNPENETFGLILVNEAMHKVKDISGYLSTGYGAGIYAFNPAFENTGKYNGDKTFSTATNMFAPRRVRISDDGRIFATAQDGSGEYLWEINPKDLSQWTNVFQGTNAGYTLKDGSGKFVAGTNAGFDVRGEGENLQLLMLSADKPGAQVANFKCHIYNLGTATTWSTAPTTEVTGADYMLVTNQSNAQFDKDGGVWYIQYRGTTTDAEPGLVHINKNGVEDFKWLRHNTRNAGFRFNHDFTKVAIADASFVNFYAVSKDANGKPVFTWESGFSLQTIGTQINDFAWDYADNFYSVGHNKEKAVAYRLPYSGEVTTPAASKYTFRVEYEVTVDENADNTTALTSFEGKTVTAKVVRDFTNNNYMTLTLPFNMSVAQVNQAFGSGNATIYTFASTQKDAEGTLELHFNTTTSIQAGHPYILKLNNAVNGFEVAGVTISTTPSDNEQDGITMQPVLDAGGTLSGATQYWLASDNYLYHAQTYPTPVLGLRAIFDIPAGSRVRARAVFNSNETTDVVDLTPDQTTTPTVKKVLHKGQSIIIRGEEKYTIQGQRME